MPNPTPPLPPAGPKASNATILPPYCWDPPESLPLRPWPGIPKPDGSRYGPYPYPDTNLPKCTVIESAPFETHPGQEHSNSSSPHLQMNPHPYSNFAHVDPPEADNPNAKQPKFDQLLGRFDPATNPDDAQRIAELNYLQRMNRTVGADSDNFQRLKRSFDLVVCRTHHLLVNINNAVKANDPKAYVEARDAYRAFVANLDDHEPHFTHGGVDPANKRFGYGRNLKWVFVDPVIEETDIPKLGRMVVITNARIIIKWNPHSSSSGVPVLH